MAKQVTLNPDAIDGDADGLVQDGTPFERPAAPAGFIYAEDGDNYQVIADRLGKITAVDLWKLNFENVVYPGMLIKVA